MTNVSLARSAPIEKQGGGPSPTDEGEQVGDDGRTARTGRLDLERPCPDAGASVRQRGDAIGGIGRLAKIGRTRHLRPGDLLPRGPAHPRYVFGTVGCRHTVPKHLEKVKPHWRAY
jgi:hypothetical protein